MLMTTIDLIGLHGVWTAFWQAFRRLEDRRPLGVRYGHNREADNDLRQYHNSAVNVARYVAVASTHPACRVSSYLQDVQSSSGTII